MSLKAENTETTIGENSGVLHGYSRRAVGISLSQIHRKYSAEPILCRSPNRKSILKTGGSYHSRSVIIEPRGLLQQEDGSSSNPNDDDSSRRDRYGNEILGGHKKHRISFSESLVEVREVEAYKDSNKIRLKFEHTEAEKDEERDDCLCTLF
eukprot:TRINITY_DN3399_c0_g2_i1.p1 TRINITY_DN3399_c0_g2~~TRINITY_DN3399_c0_g2_i1.p1  ORF type:complete len:152 (+),score=10.47 TRINITY_DN3399_c0_g2_i1:142-597(+)